MNSAECSALYNYLHKQNQHAECESIVTPNFTFEFFFFLSFSWEKKNGFSSSFYFNLLSISIKNHNYWAPCLIKWIHLWGRDDTDSCLWVWITSTEWLWFASLNYQDKMQLYDEKWIDLLPSLLICFLFMKMHLSLINVMLACNYFVYLSMFKWWYGLSHVSIFSW